MAHLLVDVSMIPRNLQRLDPRTNGPRKNLRTSNSAIATYFSWGPVGFGPIEFLME